MKQRQDNLPVTFAVATTDQHFEQILLLQKQNHYSCISEDQQEQEGFVFAAHSMELLKVMAASVPQVIALYQGKVIGYNLAMTNSMERVLPSLGPMFQEFKNWNYEGKPLMDYQFIIGGQVCVDKNFRGMGLIRSLYHKTKEMAGDNYQCCVTEISTRNLNSLKAHQRMGFEILGTYNDGVENWNLVIWKFA